MVYFDVIWNYRQGDWGVCTLFRGNQSTVSKKDASSVTGDLKDKKRGHAGTKSGEVQGQQIGEVQGQQIGEVQGQ